MRSAPKILCLALMSAAAPALAEEPYDDTGFAETLSDPEMVREMGDRFAVMLEAMMAMPIGPMAHAMADALPDSMGAEVRALPRDATVGDLAARGDPIRREQMTDQVRAMPEMLGTMAGFMAAMLPELRAMTDRMRERIDDRAD